MDITVITPSIPGRVHMLAECIESIKAQEYQPVKHLYQIDSDYRGPAWTRNRLVDKTDSGWISFLDDDDLALPMHLLTHSECETSDVIFSWGEAVHPDGGRKLFDSSYNPERILSGHNTIPVTATVRTELFREVGGFSETERFEDWHLWKKLIQYGARFTCIEQVTWEYRVNHGIDSRNEKEWTN